MDGFESILIVGLPDASGKDSKERVMVALHTLGFSLVEKKVIINEQAFVRPHDNSWHPYERRLH